MLRPCVELDSFRIATVLIVGLACMVDFAIAAMYPEGGQTFLVLSLVVTGPMFIKFCTEFDRMPDAANLGVHSLSGRLCIAPLISGGGRGALLLLLSLAWVLGSHLLAQLLFDEERSLFGDDDAVQLVIVCGYAAIYVLIPSTIFALLPRWAWRPYAARIAIVIACVAPILYRLQLHMQVKREQMILDPTALFEAVKRDGGMTRVAEDDLILLLQVAAFAVAFAVPRVVFSVYEVVHSDTRPAGS